METEPQGDEISFEEYCEEYISSSRYGDIDNITAFLRELPQVYKYKDTHGNTGIY